MNRRLLTPGIKIESADAFNFSTSNVPNPFTINGNNIQQSVLVTTTAYTPALDIGTITTMSKRGGAPAAPSANNVTVAQSLVSGPTGVSKTGVKIAFPEFRVVTNAGAPTQLLFSGPGPAGSPVVPAALFPPFLKQWVVPFINNGLPVAARLFINTDGVLVATLMASTLAIPVAFTAPFGFNGDIEVEYILD
jgi:hypothetical protein